MRRWSDSGSHCWVLGCGWRWQCCGCPSHIAFALSYMPCRCSTRHSLITRTLRSHRCCFTITIQMRSTRVREEARQSELSFCSVQCCLYVHSVPSRPPTRALWGWGGQMKLGRFGDSQLVDYKVLCADGIIWLTYTAKLVQCQLLACSPYAGHLLCAKHLAWITK